MGKTSYSLPEELLLKRINRIVNSIIAFISSYTVFFIYPLLPIGGNYILPSMISLVIGILVFRGREKIAVGLFYTFTFIATVINISSVYISIQILLQLQLLLVLAMFLISAIMFTKPNVIFLTFLAASLLLHPTLFIFSIPILVLTISLEKMDIRSVIFITLVFTMMYAPFALAMNLANPLFSGDQPVYRLFSIPHTNFHGSHSLMLGESDLSKPISLMAPARSLWELIAELMGVSEMVPGESLAIVEGLNKMIDRYSRIHGLNITANAEILLSSTSLFEWLNIFIKEDVGVNLILRFLASYILTLFAVILTIAFSIVIALFLEGLTRNLITRRLEKIYPKMKVFSTLLLSILFLTITLYFIDALQAPLSYVTVMSFGGVAFQYNIFFTAFFALLISLRDFYEMKIEEILQLKSKIMDAWTRFQSLYSDFSKKCEELRNSVVIDVPEAVVAEKIYESVKSDVKRSEAITTLPVLKSIFTSIEDKRLSLEKFMEKIETDIKLRLKALNELQSALISELENVGFNLSSVINRLKESRPWMNVEELIKPPTINIAELTFEKAISNYGKTRENFIGFSRILVLRYGQILNSLERLMPEVHSTHPTLSPENVEKDPLSLDIFVKRTVISLINYSEKYLRLVEKLSKLLNIEVKDEFKNIFKADAFMETVNAKLSKIVSEINETIDGIEKLNVLISEILQGSGVDTTFTKTGSYTYVEDLKKIEKSLIDWKSGEELASTLTMYLELKTGLEEALEKDRVLAETASVFPYLEMYVKDAIKQYGKIHVSDLPLMESHLMAFISLFTQKNYEYSIDRSGLIMLRGEVK